MVYPRLLYPVTLTASNNVLRVGYPSGVAAQSVTVAAGTYYLSRDASVLAGQADLLLAVEVALGVTWPAGDWDVGFANSAGSVVIANINDTFDLCFDAALSTLQPVLGYASTFQASGAAQEIIGQYQHQYGWYPERSVRFSTGTGPERTVAIGDAISGRVALANVASAAVRYEQIDVLGPGKIRINDPSTGLPWGSPAYTYLNESMETFWNSLTACTDFRWYPDAATYLPAAPDPAAPYSRMAIKDPAFLGRLVDKSIVGGPGGGAARLMYPTNELYSVVLPMVPYVV